jgi:hypothetical protein
VICCSSSPDRSGNTSTFNMLKARRKGIRQKPVARPTRTVRISFQRCPVWSRKIGLSDTAGWSRIVKRPLSVLRYAFETSKSGRQLSELANNCPKERLYDRQARWRTPAQIGAIQPDCGAADFGYCYTAAPRQVCAAAVRDKQRARLMTGLLIVARHETAPGWRPTHCVPEPRTV